MKVFNRSWFSEWTTFMFSRDSDPLYYQMKSVSWIETWLYPAADWPLAVSRRPAATSNLRTVLFREFRTNKTVLKCFAVLTTSFLRTDSLIKHPFSFDKRFIGNWRICGLVCTLNHLTVKHLKHIHTNIVRSGAFNVALINCQISADVRPIRENRKITNFAEECLVLREEDWT